MWCVRREVIKIARSKSVETSLVFSLAAEKRSEERGVRETDSDYKNKPMEKGSKCVGRK
jgi:hypothetical protein